MDRADRPSPLPATPSALSPHHGTPGPSPAVSHLSRPRGARPRRLNIQQEDITFAEGSSFPGMPSSGLPSREPVLHRERSTARASSSFRKTTDWPRSLYPTPARPETLVRLSHCNRVKEPTRGDTRKKIEVGWRR